MQLQLTEIEILVTVVTDLQLNVFRQCESFHALSGRPSGQISCQSGGS